MSNSRWRYNDVKNENKLTRKKINMESSRWFRNRCCGQISVRDRFRCSSIVFFLPYWILAASCQSWTNLISSKSGKDMCFARVFVGIFSAVCVLFWLWRPHLHRAACLLVTVLWMHRLACAAVLYDVQCCVAMLYCVYEILRYWLGIA